MPKRLFEYGGQWIGREDGTPNLYRYWYDGSRRVRRRSLRTADFDEAKNCLVELIQKEKKLKNASSGQARLSYLLEAYLSEHASKRKSSRAIEIRGQHIMRFFGACLVSEVTHDRQWEFMRHLHAVHNHSSEYISMIQKALSGALTHACKRGRLQAPPYIITAANEIADELDIDAPVARDRVLDFEEMGMMLEWAGSEHIFRFLILSINTMARPEALCELTQFQCNSQHGFIDLNPPRRRQTHKYRPVVPMTDALRGWLDYWGGDRLLTWRHKTIKGPDGKDMKIQQPVKTVKKAVKRLATTVGFDDVSQYTIRHTMATYLRSKGVPKWEVEGFMGHAGDSQTDVYAKFQPDYLSKARIALDEYMDVLSQTMKRNVLPPSAPKLLPNKRKRG